MKFEHFESWLQMGHDEEETTASKTIMKCLKEAVKKKSTKEQFDTFRQLTHDRLDESDLDSLREEIEEAIDSLLEDEKESLMEAFGFGDDDDDDD